MASLNPSRSDRTAGAVSLLPASHALATGTVRQGVDERPRLPTLHLRRERLLETLLESPRRLSLICAPGGFGKSLLLNEASRYLPSEVVWLRLQGERIELADFTRRLAAQLANPGLSEADPQTLLKALQRRAEGFCLVLDDYPAEGAAELDRWLDRLLAQAPAGLRLWVSCRRRPHWNLLPLALEGELLELGPSALAFDRTEFAALARVLGPAIEVAEQEEAWQLSQGWCAGARLALDLQSAGNRPAVQRLRDYLQEDLLSRLSDEARALLIGLAHLPRASQQLCAQLWPELDGGRLFLDELLPLALFEPASEDGRWWRLLPALANALGGEQNAGLNRLRLDCCRLLRESGLHDEAVDLALRAGQPETAASFMDRLSSDWLFRGRHMANWLDWRTRLPLQLLESTPFLIYLNAQVLLSSWRLDEAQVCIARLGMLLPHPQASINRRILANWQALHGTLRGLQGDAAAAREHCGSALEHLPPSDWHSAYLCYSTLARVEMSDGQPQRAEQLLRTAQELSRRKGCLASEMLIDTDCIRLLILTGRLGEARVLLQECLQRLPVHGGEYGLPLGRLHLLRGELALLEGDLESAREALALGQAQARQCADPFVLHAGIGLAEISACLDQHEAAAAHLREVERHMQCARIDPGCYEMVIGQQRLRGLLRQGQAAQVLPAARALAVAFREGKRLPPLHAPSLAQRIHLVLVLALQGCAELREAEQACRELLQSCARLSFAGLLPEAQVLHQGLLQGPGEERQSLRSCSLVLACEPAARAVGNTAAATLAAGVELLTPREFSVLELLAEGLSNQEIGERLYISLNTVKAHTIRINHKLGVKRRTQAVMRARTLGMLA